MSMITIMHGRTVIQSEIPEAIKQECHCFDCGEKANVLVTEYKEQREFDPKRVEDGFDSWFWCGICDVGG